MVNCTVFYYTMVNCTVLYLYNTCGALPEAFDEREAPLSLKVSELRFREVNTRDHFHSRGTRKEWAIRRYSLRQVQSNRQGAMSRNKCFKGTPYQRHPRRGSWQSS